MTVESPEQNPRCCPRTAPSPGGDRRAAHKHSAPAGAGPRGPLTDLGSRAAESEHKAVGDSGTEGGRGGPGTESDLRVWNRPCGRWYSPARRSPGPPGNGTARAEPFKLEPSPAARGLGLAHDDVTRTPVFKPHSRFGSVARPAPTARGCCAHAQSLGTALLAERALAPFPPPAPPCGRCARPSGSGGRGGGGAAGAAAAAAPVRGLASSALPCAPPPALGTAAGSPPPASPFSCPPLACV